MERSETLQLAELFKHLLSEEPDLHEGMLEQQALAYLRERLGSYWQDVRRAYMHEGLLYIQTYSSALMHTLNISKDSLRIDINQYIGAELVSEIRIHN